MPSNVFYMIAGEASGDLYGARLIHAVRRIAPSSLFYGFGGAKMEAAGCMLSRRLGQLEMIGFVEVIKKLPEVVSNFKTARKDILRLKPDALVLIDYPGFNLRMAGWASKKGIKVFYYIAPQVWAWKENRVRKMKEFIDHLFVILPFEYEYFSGKGLKNIHFFGHPLKEELNAFIPAEDFRQINQLPPSKKLIAVLPGSRKNELGKMLPVVIRLIKSMPEFHFLISAMKKVDENEYERVRQLPNATVLFEQTYDVMKHADAGLIKSGTSTLEAALLGLPQVVFYRLHPVSAMIIRWFVKIPYVALPNIILKKQIVPELLQEDCSVEHIRKSLLQILQDEKKEEILEYYLKLKKMLFPGGNTSDKVAWTILQAIKKQDVDS